MSKAAVWKYAESLHQAALLLYTDNYIDSDTYERLMKEIVSDWLDEQEAHEMLWNAGLVD